MPDNEQVDLTVECGKCGELNYYDESGKLVLPCGCCQKCKGSCIFDGSMCFPCAGTGRRLAGSEDITAVERRKTPPPVIVKPVTKKRRPR